MKLPILFLITSLAVGSLAYTSVKAEEPTPQPQPTPQLTPAAPPPEKKPEHYLHGKPKKHQEALHSPLSKLSPEERQKALQALRTIWQDAEVAQHRSEFQKSREKYLSSLREAASDLDPEVEKLLKPMMGSIINGQSLDQLIPGNPQLGHYLRAVRLNPEQVDALTEPQRERLNAVAPKVLADSRFKSAAQEAKNMSPSPDRREAAKKLVQLARTITSEIDPELKFVMDSPIVPPRKFAQNGPGGKPRPHLPFSHGGKKDPIDAAPPPPPPAQ